MPIDLQHPHSKFWSIRIYNLCKLYGTDTSWWAAYKKLPFYLSPIKSDSALLASWISAALAHNVENLCIIYPHNDFILPRSIINHSSLTRLHISARPRQFQVPKNISFRNLTTLTLKFMGFESSNNVCLKFTFPVLKTLELVYCVWLNAKDVEIHAPKLTKFMSKDCRAEVADHSIKIIGNQLQNVSVIYQTSVWLGRKWWMQL